MRKLKSTLPNMMLSLGFITILSGLILGVMYSVTMEPIEESARRMQSEALAEVLPPFDNDPEAAMKCVEVAGKEFEIYPAEMEGHSVGAAVKGYSLDGFSGEIVVMCGFDNDGNIVNYRVLKQAETPGLGARMELWFRDPTAARSVIGRSPGQCRFIPAKDGGDIDGITAATISSRAFLTTIREAYEAYREYCGLRHLKSADADASSAASRRVHDN